MILLEILVETDVFNFVCVCVCVREREVNDFIYGALYEFFYLQFVAVDLEKHFGFLCRSKIQCVCGINGHITSKIAQNKCFD